MNDPEMISSCIFVLKVPQSLLGMSAPEVRQVLEQPQNLGPLLDEVARTIVEWAGKPVNHRELLTNLAANLLPNSDNN